jgi:hypothetical protein
LSGKSGDRFFQKNRIVRVCQGKVETGFSGKTNEKTKARGGEEIMGMETA